METSEEFYIKSMMLGEDWSYLAAYHVFSKISRVPGITHTYFDADTMAPLSVWSVMDRGNGRDIVEEGTPSPCNAAGV